MNSQDTNTKENTPAESYDTLKDKQVSPAWHNEIIQRLRRHEEGHSVTYSLEDANLILQKHLDAHHNKQNNQLRR